MNLSQTLQRLIRGWIDGVAWRTMTQAMTIGYLYEYANRTQGEAMRQRSKGNP